MVGVRWGVGRKRSRCIGGALPDAGALPESPRRSARFWTAVALCRFLGLRAGRERMRLSSARVGLNLHAFAPSLLNCQDHFSGPRFGETASALTLSGSDPKEHNNWVQLGGRV